MSCLVYGLTVRLSEEICCTPSLVAASNAASHTVAILPDAF
jgi:hypothetical protein